MSFTDAVTHTIFIAVQMYFVWGITTCIWAQDFDYHTTVVLIRHHYTV